MGEADLQYFLESAKSTPYYALFYTALFTGVRRSELLALRWADIDFLGCQLSVCRTVHQLSSRDIIYQQLKTTKDSRLIALSP